MDVVRIAWIYLVVSVGCANVGTEPPSEREPQPEAPAEANAPTPGFRSIADRRGAEARARA